ncbi:MAG TPA: TIGR02281 family clan AA aspartic protease [Gammaproteobacteria bacterium]|nr:TIGR02281 family clan AA aspartic protease [Gammaproteobacteria bacterium]
MTTENRQPDNGQRLGKGMIVAAWILLLLLLTWFFNDRLDAQRNPNRQLSMTTTNGIPEVQLERNRAGHYVTSGTINGQPVEFMLDTGATDVSIPASVADRIGLERGRRAWYQTANGTISAWQTTLDEIRIGPLRMGPVAASINPNSGDDAVLLGMSFLRQLDFSQQGNTLTLKPATRKD